jgi:hypothetical protein
MGWEDDLKIYFRVVVCEDGRWMELAQDRVQWWDLVLAALNLGVLLPVLVLYVMLYYVTLN